MLPSHPFFVYIATNRSRVLYTGVTSDLERRMHEHRLRLRPGFASRYGIDRLVYFEFSEDVLAAIAREKQIKGWKRSRRVALIEARNPGWRDLSRALSPSLLISFLDERVSEPPARSPR